MTVIAEKKKEKKSGRLRRPLFSHYHIEGSHSDRREESLAKPNAGRNLLQSQTQGGISCKADHEMESLSNPTRREESLAKPLSVTNAFH